MRPRYKDLFKALKDPDPARADTAFDAILFDRGEALPDLVECYQGNPKDPLLRFYAVQLMGFSGDKRAVEPVLAALDDPEPDVRAEACRALEDLRARDVTEQLEARTRDVAVEVRRAARDALEQLGRR
ncbi:MAG: HEAT repeat domain-containing protein [Alphaproteobacteria bacterium]|nr:HEAT repeat domain-containing protein [Alphaproteobacteria bacterium]